MNVITGVKQWAVGMTVVLLFAVAGRPGLAETYYVAQNHPKAADSNPGTEELPWRTLTQAANVAKAGDIVWIKAGIYQETLQPYNSGERGKPITFQAFGDDPVFITSPKYMITGWQKVEGMEKVYEAPSPVEWPPSAMGLRGLLLAVDGEAVPGPGKQWALGVPGLKEVTDEPYIFQGEEKTPVLKRFVLTDDNKIRLNLGGEDPNQHKVEAVPKSFFGVRLKTHYIVVRGLTIVDVGAGVQCTGNFCSIEDCVAREVWGDFVCDSGFWAEGQSNVVRRCTAINCFRIGIAVGKDSVVEECLVLGAGTRVPYRVAPEDTLGAPGWEWGTGWRTGINGTGRYNVAADNVSFGWWIDIHATGAWVYGNLIARSGTGIYNEAQCNDTKLKYNACVENENGFVWRSCRGILAQYNYIADNKVGVGIWSWFQAPSPTNNVFRNNLVLRSQEAKSIVRWSHVENLEGIDASSAAPRASGEERPAASFVDSMADDWDLFEDNIYTVSPGGVFTRIPKTAVPYWPEPATEREYKTLAEYQAETGKECGSQEREGSMEEYGLKLYTIRIPHSTAPHRPMPIVGNPVREAIHSNPVESYGWEDPYFWKASARPFGVPEPIPWGSPGPAFELRWGRRPYLKGTGARLNLDAPAVVWLTATGKGPEEAQAEAGGWWSPSLPTVPGAKIHFSFLVAGKELEAPTEDTVVAWVRFSSLTGQHVTRQFVLGKNDEGQLVEPGPYQGTFSWRKVSAVVVAPQEAERFAVFFGIRPCQGTARFADIDLQTEPGEAPPEGEARPKVEALDMEKTVADWIRSLD